MMVEVVLYSGKVVGISAMLFLYYKLFLKEKTFHHFNRFFLLGSVLVSLLLPLLRTSYFTVQVSEDMYSLMNGLQRRSVVETPGSTIGYVPALLVVCTTGTVLFTARFLTGIFRIMRFKKRFPMEIRKGIRFYNTDLEPAPFSYFRNLFWKNSIAINSRLGKQILKHELAHIEQKHTYDKMFMEVMQSLFWFNPFMTLIKKEIHLIHEYLADKEAVDQSDTKAFAQMLLESHFTHQRVPAASPLMSSSLKKRLYMLKKPKTKFSYVRRILVLPFVFALAFVFVVNAQNSELRAAEKMAKQHVNRIIAGTYPGPTPGVEQPDEIRKKSPVKIRHKAFLRSTGNVAAQTFRSDADVKIIQSEAQIAGDLAVLAREEAALAREEALLAHEEALLIKELEKLK